MSLAIFDLDDTLTLQDTESLWQSFLVHQNIIPQKEFLEKKAAFEKSYQAGHLNFHAVIEFSLNPIKHMNLEEQLALRDLFIATTLTPNIIPQAQELVSSHKEKGHTVIIISAGHEFLIHAAAKFFDVHDVLCTELQKSPSGSFLPVINGDPVYRAQKLVKLKEWLKTHPRSFDLTYFYSDSINDLPLLEYVHVPTAVNPCPALTVVAQQRQWPILKLKETLFEKRAQEQSNA